MEFIFIPYRLYLWLYKKDKFWVYNSAKLI